MSGRALLLMKCIMNRVLLFLQEFTLGKWGPVTEALASTLLQLTQRSGGSFSPLHLLDALRKKHSQFQGYNQHDAHELLRTLLDCVKTEDIRVSK